MHNIYPCHNVDGDPDDPDAYVPDQSPPPLGEPRAVPPPDPLHHNDPTITPQYEGEAMDYDEEGPSQPRPLLINRSDAWYQGLLNSQQSEQQQQQRQSEQQRQIIEQQNDIEMLQLKHEESQQQLLTHQKLQEQLIIEQQNDLIMLQRRLKESQQHQQLLTYEKQQQQQLLDQQNSPKIFQQQHEESHQTQQRPGQQDLIKQYRHQHQYEEHSNQVDVHNVGQRREQQHEQQEIFHSELQRLPILQEKGCHAQLKQQSLDKELVQDSVLVENTCFRQQHEQQEQHTELGQPVPAYVEEPRGEASQQPAAVEQQDHAAGHRRVDSDPQPLTASKSVPFLLPSINHLSLAGAEEEPDQPPGEKSEAVVPDIMDLSVQVIPLSGTY